MKAIAAVAITTIRSSLRSHVVHVVLFFMVLTVFVLPATIASDGTAQGLIQVSLTYTLDLVGLLLSIVTLWLGCTVVTDDIECYQVHMVLAKPISRASFWCGKMLGILALQGVLLLVAAIGIYGVTMWRYQRGHFPPAERKAIANELLVGRRLFEPRPVPLEQLVDKEFKRRKDATGMPPNVSEEMVRSSIRRELSARITEVRAGEPPRVWIFENLPQVPEDGNIFLRFRLYVDSATSKDQRLTDGILWVYNPKDNTMYPYSETNSPVQQYMGGVWHQLRINPAFLAEHNRLIIGYENRDPQGKSVVFQLADGPNVMLPVTSFLMNYARVIVLVFAQLAFLAILGCTCGALLSTPVAIFLSFAYVIIGMVIVAMRPATPDDVIIPKGFFMHLLYLVRIGAGYIIVSVNDLNQVSLLAKGELIEYAAMGFVILKVVILHGLPIALIGLWLFRRRELGLVVRR